MRHLSEGRVRAYLDDALDAGQRDRVRAHLKTCARCADRVAQLSARRYRVDAHLAVLDLQHASPSVSSQAAEAGSGPATPARLARARLATYESEKEEAKIPMSMLKRPFTSRYRPAWIAVILVLILGMSLTLQPVRAFAANLLSLFRLQKIEVVEFNPSALFNEQGLESAMGSLEQVMDEQVTVDVQGEPQVVDETELRSLSSIRVRLPEAVTGEPHYVIQPGGTISFNVDLPRLRALLTELGYTDVSLPDSLNGADVSVQLMPMITAAYGACEPDTEAWAGAHGPSDFGGQCTVLVQMRSPQISAPGDLDVDQLGQAYLQLLGMSADEAARFSQRVDWTTTLIIPLPRSEVTYQNVTVDGADGVMIRPTEHRLAQSDYVMIWVKDDVVYAMMGSGSLAEATSIADSLQ